MKLFRNEETQGTFAPEKAEQRIQRRECSERMHHVLILGLAGMLLASIAAHIFAHNRK